jgi:thymidine kinase
MHKSVTRSVVKNFQRQMADEKQVCKSIRHKRLAILEWPSQAYPMLDGIQLIQNAQEPHTKMSLQISGSIHLLLGSMFAGKTTELFRCYRRLVVAGLRCLMIKYEEDTRYSQTDAATHDKQMVQATRCKTLMYLLSNHDFLDNLDAIFIDEGQFFGDVVEFAETCANAGKDVYVAALDGTHERRAFGRVLELVPLCESVIKLTAVCHTCKREAAFTRRLGSETETKVIGGADKYEAVCRACYHKLARVHDTCASVATIRDSVLTVASPTNPLDNGSE